ncbi:TetR/AcrR family transcriptional regulator [Corynebacterium caspium]|uniref:TetR/AcrR family transcriptional regulator n=1 Tax=Corynebacterium caspium TaxID=234828 RepID=UPI00036453AB|nr:TetR family transcriptional regulator [Corynebacterium caspium]WKD59293.1 HTH-type transcriptional regulator BetI [Corynebacterium caspium DSM 44850]
MASNNVQPPGLGRRDKIIDAALECIMSYGVAGLTLRLVADRAGVALGSIGYYFDDKDGLLSAAFKCFTMRSAKQFADYYDSVCSLEEARAATVRMLSDSASSRTQIILGSELYSLSLRRPRHRIVLSNWTQNCRAVMARYFDEDTTFILDALYEGVLLHRTMKLGEYNDDRIARAVERLTPAESYIGPQAI